MKFLIILTTTSLFLSVGILSAGAQTISPIDSPTVKISVERFEDCVKRKARPNADMGILVSVAELSTLLSTLSSNGVTEVYFHIVAMEKSNLTVWQAQNPMKMAEDLKDKFALVMKYYENVPAPIAEKIASPAPFAISGIPTGFLLPPESRYVAMGRLCPPPADCRVY